MGKRRKGRGKGRRTTNQKAPAVVRKEAEQAAQTPTAQAVEEPVSVETNKTSRFKLDRVVLWTIYFLLVLLIVGGYIIPLLGWSFQLLDGSENEPLSEYLTNASAVVGVISIGLGVVSLHQSRQSDIRAEEMTRLLRDVQGQVNSIYGEIGSANTMIRGMLTAKSEEPPPSKAGDPWSKESEKSRESEPH